MPEIMRQYGQTLVVAIAGALLISLLFVTWPSSAAGEESGSVLHDIGARASQRLEGAGAGASTARFDDYAARVAPTLALKGPVKQHDEFVLVNQFTIADADGAVWDADVGSFVLDGVSHGGLVQIESIVAPDGSENIGGFTGEHVSEWVAHSQESGDVTFTRAGVYQVRVYVKDGDNVDATFTVPLVVDFVMAEELPIEEPDEPVEDPEQPEQPEEPGE